ncbi:complex I intermediate-associated protein 30, mitochondrial-like [Oppia nitens]|uniref:complex I intermediate-associated protein 30, mitochondrial-like n=1 Tax=Oppia nitens TaxID=1686743 RepID=UPI0023DAB3A1|nr:complex I intermediate-associated protein 30, mitochondrial-like [Oppia nitens]
MILKRLVATGVLAANRCPHIKSVNIYAVRPHTGAGLYQPYLSGHKKYEEKRDKNWEQLSEWDKLKMSVKTIKQETSLWVQEMRDTYGLDNTTDFYEDQEIIKYWDFNQRNNDRISSYCNTFNRGVIMNDMKRWRTACDSDHNEGYSRCDWTVSPSGRSLFHGYIDTKLPNDGEIMKAGWAFLGCERHRRSFHRQNYFNWTGFTHLLVRCRGDGRNWIVVLNVSDDKMDVTWFDRYQYVLYTHGGPYWQWCKIPFSRFYFQHKGYAQDQQFPICLHSVSQVGFMLADNTTGPFSLEIDYVGVMRDQNWTEKHAYEHYYHKEHKWRDFGST